MNTCEWKPVSIEEFSEYYLVSNKGDVYSVRRNKVLSPKMSKTGYLRVNLCGRNGVHRTLGIHRLVALAFIPNPNNKPTVNHKDERKTNNNAENLEWMTNKEQNAYGSRTERARKNTDYTSRNIDYRSVAEKHDYSRIDMCNRKKCRVFRDGEFIGEFISQRAASEHTGVSIGKVSQCMSGLKSSCKGFVFTKRRFPEDDEV